MDIERLKEAKRLLGKINPLDGSDWDDGLYIAERVIDDAIARQSATSEPCEWCDGKEYTIDSRDYACLEIVGNKLTAYGEGVATGYINYCPNCGRRLED